MNLYPNYFQLIVKINLPINVYCTRDLLNTQKVSDSWVLRKTFGSHTKEVKGDWEKLYNKELLCQG